MNWVSQEIILPSLVEMKILSIVDFPWNVIRTPRLQRLYFDKMLAYLMPFLRRHASLKCVDCETWLEYYEIGTLSDAEREVTELGVYGNIEAFLPPISKDPFPFPNVIHLRLYISDTVNLSLQGFENLVRSLCLQSDVRNSKKI